LFPPGVAENTNGFTRVEIRAAGGKLQGRFGTGGARLRGVNRNASV
jgi:hypothetical protein